MTNTNPDARAAFLPPSRVATMLSVCTATVYRLIHRGILTAHRVARQWRIARADLERYLEQARLPERYGPAQTP